MISKFLDAIIDFIFDMIFKKGEKRNRKKSLKQFWKDHKEEEKKKSDEIWALPLKEKIKRSGLFLWRIIWVGTIVAIVFSTLAIYTPDIFKWLMLFLDGSWISELKEPGSQWK